MAKIFSEEDQKKIVARLNERGVGKCPMCGRGKLSLVDGFFHNQLHDKIVSGAVATVLFVPTVALICDNCGFSSQHALGSLGLLDEFKNKFKS